MTEIETKLTDRWPKGWRVVAENDLARNALAAVLCVGSALVLRRLGSAETPEVVVWFPLGVALAAVLLLK